jgi:branched-chain amino acid transport system ATP-binding protein
MTDANELTVEDLEAKFGGLTALAGISLTIEPGETVAIIGPNGAGKSTLLNCVSGLVRPTAGRVYYRGQALLGRAPHKIARHGVGRTFQGDVAVASLSLRETVLLGAAAGERQWRRRSAARVPAGSAQRVGSRADELLAAIGLEHAGDRQIREMPYGHRKLIDIARALVAQPSIMMYDEPSSGLSSSEKSDLCRVISNVASQKVSCQVIIEHDMKVVRQLASRVIALDFGVIIADGPVETVLQDERVLTSYFGASVDPTDRATDVEQR